MKIEPRVTLLTASVILSLLTVAGSAHADYPRAKINNKTLYPAAGTVQYASAFCKNDGYSVPAGQLQKDGSIKPGVWQAPGSRGVCLITGIDGQLRGEGGGRGVMPYSSSGTSYGNFIIQATEKGYRIYSDHELKAEEARDGKSPGFRIENRTKWPVSIGLEQVGCLYYGTIMPGEFFDRDTGGVWFTIKANIQPDGKEPRTDWDCAKPVVKVVGAVLLAAATGGAGAFATGATTGAVLIAAGTATAAPLAKFGVEQAGTLLSKNGAGEWKGQFAGGDWPFRCDKKPLYVLSGGWELKQQTNGNYIVSPGWELRLTKQNNCGNSMMSTTSVAKPILPSQ